jgi:hypothetical protein
MIEGELNVQTLRLSLGDAEHDIPWLIYVQAGQKAIVQTKVPAIVPLTQTRKICR